MVVTLTEPGLRQTQRLNMSRSLTLLGLVALAAAQQTVVELPNLPGFHDEASVSIVEALNDLTTYDLACALSSRDCDLVGHATCILGGTTWSASATDIVSGGAKPQHGKHS